MTTDRNSSVTQPFLAVWFWLLVPAKNNTGMNARAIKRVGLFYSGEERL